MPEVRTVTVDLVRHGKTVAGNCFLGQTDAELTQDALTDMMQRLSPATGWQKIYSSPLKRCLQVAKKLAKINAIELHTVDSLGEIHFGEWEGKTAAELQQTDPLALSRFWDDPLHNTPAGGESYSEFSLRIQHGLQTCIYPTLGSASHVGVIVHGGVIRTLLTNWFRLPPDHYYALEIQHGSISSVQLRFNSQNPDSPDCRLIKVAC